MGINRNDESWTQVVGSWRDAQICKNAPRGTLPGECCDFHLWQLQGEVFGQAGKIITSPQAEQFIAAHRIHRGPTGKPVAQTARGRRRRQKLDAQR